MLWQLQFRGWNTMTLGILSLLPVGVTLVSLLVFRRVALCLFLGAVAGYVVLLIHDDKAPVSVFDFWHREQSAVMLFAILMACLGALLQRAGAVRVFYASLHNAMHTRKKAHALASLFILPGIFDEFNAGLRSSTFMRKTFEALGLSREKLSFVTDQTASFGPSMVGISIFFAFFVSLLTSALQTAGIVANSLALALESITYHFYGWFSLVIILCVAVSGREFGNMARLEQTARERGFNHVPNIFTSLHFGKLILFYGSLLALYLGGLLILVTTKLEIHANSIMAFPVGASFALFFAVLFVFLNRLLKPVHLVAAITEGLKNVAPIIIIMVAAWAFGDSLEQLGTATYLFDTFFNAFNPLFVPVLLFAVGALVSMLMGMSFGTIAFIAPLALATAFMISHQEIYVLTCIASLMGGAIFGGHCSELYDSTVQAVMGARSDIARHMESKLVYVFLAAVLSLFASTIVLALPFLASWFFLFGVAVIILLTALFGKRVIDPVESKIAKLHSELPLAK